MSIEIVKKYLEQFNLSERVLEFTESSATVELAAQRLGVIPARIAKTLSLKQNDKTVLVVTAGDAKIDNSKYKQFFHTKAHMLSFEEVEKLTGHPVGGVCPFANPDNVEVYLDVSMKRFDIIYPAAGTPSSAVKLTCDELFTSSKAKEWIDVCKY